jgi:hypothetical protein
MIRFLLKGAIASLIFSGGDMRPGKSPAGYEELLR